MEETEYAFLRSRGLSVVLKDGKGTIGFPRVSVELKVIQPAVLNEQIHTHLELLSVDFKSIQYHFELVNERAELIALGKFQVACCRFPDDKPPYAIIIPDFIMEALQPTSTPAD